MKVQGGRTTSVAGQAFAQASASVGGWWSSLAPPHRRGFCAIGVGFIALILLIGFLPVAAGSWLATLRLPLVWLFGWGAPVLLLGGVILAGCIIAEAFLTRVIVRRLWVWCVGLALFLLLVESQILVGSYAGGRVGALGARALSFLPPFAAQVLVMGLLLLLCVIAFQITWADLTRASDWLASHRAVVPPPVAPFSPSAMPSFPRSRSEPLARDPVPWPTASPSVSPRVSSDAVYPYPFSFTLADLAQESNLDLLRVPAYLRRAKAATGAARQQEEGYLLPPLPTRDQSRSNGAGALRPVQTAPLPPRALSEMPTPSYLAQVTKRPAGWTLPSLGLLQQPPEGRNGNAREQAERIAGRIERTLKSFGVEAEVRRTDISVGPTIIRFGVRPLERARTDERGRVMVDAAGQPIVTRTRVSRIMNLKDDLALALEVKTLRMEAPVPERPYVGIEIPNVAGRLVTLREMLESREYRDALAKSKLTVTLGRDVAGRVRVGDLARFPHVLIAGATGAGKSVCLNAFIGSIITQATPDDVRLVMIDPKMVELTLYDGIPHLLAPVITDAGHATRALEAATVEMERRYRLFSKLGVRNLDGYHTLRLEPRGAELEHLPRVVIIIDELADLMMAAADEIERHICRLAQLARATGIHLIVATQRPSVDVITGLIKANIPTRIAFMVASAVDSRTILDSGGAERLLGKGDLLFLASDAAKAERIQGAFVADDEVERLAQFWRDEAIRTGISPAHWELPESDKPTDDDEEEWDLWEGENGRSRASARPHGRHARSRRSGM